MASTTKKKISARDRARVARARADAARAERDARAEAAAAGYFSADDERAAVLSRIDGLKLEVESLEARMGARVVDLTELGESAAWQRELLGIDEPERKRLRALADAAVPARRLVESASAHGVGVSGVVAPPPA